MKCLLTIVISKQSKKLHSKEIQIELKHKQLECNSVFNKENLGLLQKTKCKTLELSALFLFAFIRRMNNIWLVEHDSINVIFVCLFDVSFRRLSIDKI